MKLELIKRLIASFTDYLKNDFDRSELFKWECQYNFQLHWDPRSAKLPEMYDQALSSQFSGMLWGGSKHSAKSMMLKFFTTNPDYTISAFRDLFDESQDVSLRIQRFISHCDELLENLPIHQRKENTHYQSHYTASLYLAFRYPKKYCIFQYPTFLHTAEYIRVHPIPQPFDIERFFKISNIISTFLWKDEMLMDTYQKLIDDHIHYQKATQLLTYELYRFVELANKV